MKNDLIESNAVTSSMTSPYRVKQGDTLSAIARRAGVSVANLQRWNGIRNPNKLEIGQVLYLSEASAFSVSFSFLDALRHPIANLHYRLEFDGRSIVGKTSSNGQIPTQITKDASSRVEVWVQDARRQWTNVSRTVSGYGHKLITMVSGAIVVPAAMEAVPSQATAESVARKATATPTSQAKPPVKPTGKPSTNNPNVTTKKAKNAKGLPVIVLGVDLPPSLLERFSLYEGGAISEQDWGLLAKELLCEPEVLKAIAKVESGGNSAFWRLGQGQGGHVPAILFERHYFSRLTRGVHDKDHPDVSWPTGYLQRKYLGKANKAMHDGQVDADDVFADYATSYLRLIKAYRLDPEAALQSCSWGKFQIMGANFGLCDAPDIQEFVNQMCTSEKYQITLLAGFIRNKPRAWRSPKNKALGKEISLWDAVKTKNWRAIAFNYNGPKYEKHNYHTKLEHAYEQYKKASA